MKQRHRKRATDRAMTAWRAADRPGFTPLPWFGRRNPRRAGRRNTLLTGEVGAVESFRMVVA